MSLILFFIEEAISAHFGVHRYVGESTATESPGNRQFSALTRPQGLRKKEESGVSTQTTFATICTPLYPGGRQSQISNRFMLTIQSKRATGDLQCLPEPKVTRKLYSMLHEQPDLQQVAKKIIDVPDGGYGEPVL